eukprot:Tamp_06490.p1 GENE.Tamp_06490~~Tamp_06490.p1  ORF type:complete len:550 (+),score=93.74 Tamp_06490:31-1650(+)
MREHQRYAERIHTAKEQLQEALARPEPFSANTFGYTGTANEPLLSHHVSSPGTLVQQYPAVAGPFSGEHAFAEELRPRPARRRKPGPKKPIISKKMWKCLNTPAVRAGEEFARTVVERNVDAEKTAANEKMARQMYMRSSARFSVSERAFSREFLETRAGQKRFGTSLSEGGLTGAHTTSQDSLGQSLPKSSHTAGSHSSRAEVLPGDLLASLERYSRNPGSLMHEKKSILQNGFLSRDGHREKVQPRFQIDDKQRTTRRVITGGTVDRLHYSDGSLAVLLPPKVVSADPSLASKPLILRDGTASTIRARTLPRPYPPREVSTAGELVMEVPSLSSVHTAHTPFFEQTQAADTEAGAGVFHQKSSASLLSTLSVGSTSQSQLFAPQNSKEFTTSLSPRSWEKLTESKAKLRAKTDKLLLRPDLDALAEYYALQKLEKEQAQVEEVWNRVMDHREHERAKLRERAMRRMALQAKAGQRVHIGSEQEEYVLERYMQEEALHQNAWTGSWTQPSTAGGSLTHKAPGDPARLFGGHHRPRETH